MTLEERIDEMARQIRAYLPPDVLSDAGVEALANHIVRNMAQAEMEEPKQERSVDAGTLAAAISIATELKLIRMAMEQAIEELGRIAEGIRQQNR